MNAGTDARLSAVPHPETVDANAIHAMAVSAE
jgi:hypothetical protein